MKTPIKATMALILCSGLAACAHWSPSDKGTAIGAVGGAAVGNAITGGSTIGTIGGAAAGGIIGHEIGQDQERDRRRR